MKLQSIESLLEIKREYKNKDSVKFDRIVIDSRSSDNFKPQYKDIKEYIKY